MVELPAARNWDMLTKTVLKRHIEQWQLEGLSKSATSTKLTVGVDDESR